ncbi:MAG: hypothetical protein OEW64_12340 [Gammaproteobacteria bacterium]|nr:hypothetical protein [Gammaproteobacteria bacterium]MDH5304869.1 hypothetical protein [Gammaproteobacteria bacterium]
MRTRIAFGLLCVALLASTFVNYRFFQAIERQQYDAPISEWMTRLSVNQQVLADSGNFLSDQTLGLVHKSIYMDLRHIKQQEKTNPGRFGAARLERLEAIIDSLNAVRHQSPDLFSAPKLMMDDDSLAEYIKLLSSSDR